MKSTAVIYKSKYGSTKKYAEWIGEELECDVLDTGSVSADTLKKYDTIIYGGGLFAGGVNGFNLITKNFDAVRDKNLILFTVGLADPNDTENTDHIKGGIKKAVSPELFDKMKIFHLRGGIDYSNLGVVHKAMMAMLVKTMKSKDESELRDEDKLMLETYGQKVDFTDKESIKPLVEYVKAI